MVPVTIDKPRNLKFDLNTFCDLEQKTGIPTGSLLKSVGDVSVTAIVYALWAGLKHEDLSLSPNLMMKMLETYIAEGKSIQELGAAISLAIMESGLFNGVGLEAPPADTKQPAKRRKVA